ncbi:hypothetical protein CapIbe_014134 [Capra ibex]
MEDIPQEASVLSAPKASSPGILTALLLSMCRNTHKSLSTATGVRSVERVGDTFASGSEVSSQEGDAQQCGAEGLS